MGNSGKARILSVPVLSLIDRLLRRRPRGNRPRLKVDQSLGAFPRAGGDISPLFVIFRTENRGPEEVEVTGLSIELDGGRYLELTDVLGGERELPCGLQPGEAVAFWTGARGLAETLAEESYGGRPRLRLLVADGLGGVHPKSFRFRVDEYLELEDA